ncbi:MAG: zinc ribbon domain-containing protein [Candidatus Tectomicrobia bacterium]|uniref:Zinc ribbon domain-containing protein n=1 Tax=Tectimicrobiota bacterium TaxID=2528274 RepID=A0A932CN80_UNCTE|nr:zinc ribbon domain-containing protein [Candidatus Tectomicrobia bacterium]
MQCPQCQYENLPDSVFCQECGTKLERVCPQCQAGNPLAGKFCRKCGIPLLGPPAAPRVPPPSGTEAAPQRGVQPEKAARVGLRPLTSDAMGYTPKHLVEKILTTRSASPLARRAQPG